MSINKLRWAAIISFCVSMSFLLLGGYFARDRVPPYPDLVVGPDGVELFNGAGIYAGQDVFQRYGLMDHGSVWGHGSQRGMEFSAVTLHRLGLSVADSLSRRDYGVAFEGTTDIQREVAKKLTALEMKTNRYDPKTKTLTLTAAQVVAYESTARYWEEVFREGEPDYGFLAGTIPTVEERTAIAKFFFWLAWAASANRLDGDYSYTNNWPADSLVGNVPTAETYLWTLGGIVSLFIVLGLFVFYVHYYGIWYGPAKGVPLAEKLIDMPLTSSQYKAAKFFLVVIVLFLLQTLFGGLLAHYTVHPGSFYVSSIAKLIPYSWAKSWHLQLAIFWIATTWVASALYLGPIFGGREPKGQGILVQILFGAILFVALGSLLGEIAGIKGLLGNLWFWFGHQGWEYLELGRFWQILLFGGLIFWLLIVYRTIGRHIRSGGGHFSSLVVFYVFSAILVVAFFGFGLFYGRGSHFSMADYWRWFVVHLWVESIFEFFGVAVIALLMVSMGLVSVRAALTVSYFTASIVFLSGILGTAHHYYWFGGPSLWLAVGSVFSSMEPVPLFGLVVRGMMEYRSIRKKGQEFPYKWPLYFLIASTFWNFLGAGVYGFLINLPIVNYYEHGTYLTMNHGHAALFGVYGLLSIALLLFSWRGLVDRSAWNDRILKVSFWGFNIGLMLMTLGTLLPVGLKQVWVSFSSGLWAARDASFFEGTFVKLLGNVRIVPDTIIIVFGVLPMTWFLFSTYRKLKPVLIGEEESIWDKFNMALPIDSEEKSRKK